MINNKQGSLDSYASDLYDSYRNSPYVSLVTEMDAGLTLDDAFVIQGLFVNYFLHSDSISGYKAALTAKDKQKKFGIDSAISGALFQSGELANNAEIQIGQYKLMQVETELGYRVKENIDKVIKDKRDLHQKISTIFPVVELPNVRLESMENLSLVNAVAANVFSEKYVLGDEFLFSENDSENFKIELKLDGQLINDAEISDSMGYQMELLIWLINKQILGGREINAGQILITGAIGKVNIGEVGSYEADYGKFGKLKFKVSD